jgi:hypothetical protein
MAERTQAEIKFIDQRTRQLMVLWAEHSIRHPEGIPDLTGVPSLTGDAKGAALGLCRSLEMHQVYFEHAITKKWLGKKVTDGCRKLTSGGWTTAASFLKR